MHAPRPYRPGGLDVAVADGGTGASDAATARLNLGIDPSAALQSNLSAVVGPVVADDDVAGYSVGSLWVNTVTDDAFIAVDVTTGAAVWDEINASASFAGASFVTIGAEAGLSDERVLTGTANQVTVTDDGAGTTVTLSTPQDIHSGASPDFAGLTVGSNNVYYATGTDVAVADGGTGASDAGTARTNLGLAIGSDVQAFSAALTDLDDVGIVTGDSYMLVGTGSGTLAWETTTTLRDSIGLGTGDAAQFTTLGVGITRTDGTLHVHTATAGSVAPSENADDLVVENSTHGGISILTPDASTGALYFGSASDSAGAWVTWDSSTVGILGNTGVMSVATHDSGAVLSLYGGINSAGIDIDHVGRVYLNYGASGATADPAADDFVVEEGDAGGMSILVPDAAISRFYMGTNTDPTGFQLMWDYPNTRMSLGPATAGGEMLLLSGDGATALTLDSSQDATFAGSIFVGTAPSGDYSDELVITGTTSAAMALQNTGNAAPVFYIDSNRTSAGANSGQILWRWDNTGVANIFCATGTDTGNKDDGELHMQTASAGSLVTQFRIDTNGACHLRAQASDPSVRTNTAAIYAKGGAAEMWVQDEAGNSTQLSPHDSEGFWWFNSYSSNRDMTLQIQVERAFRWLIEEKGMPAEYLTEYSGRPIEGNG